MMDKDFYTSPEFVDEIPLAGYSDSRAEESFIPMKSFDQAVHHFKQLYGAGEVLLWRAPARINLLGEHVDYVSYLPTASLAFGSREHEMRLMFRPREDGLVCGASMDARFPAFQFSPAENRIDEASWEAFVFNRPVPPPHWSNYVRGAASFAQWKLGAEIKRGFDFLIESTIPASSGASSSSALTVLAGAAIRRANGIEVSAEKLALESAQAEWFLGTRGGALDHTTICLARQAHAVHIAHNEQHNKQHNKQWAEQIPLPAEGYCWITFFTHAADKGREVMLDYNERAAVSRLLIPTFRKDPQQEIPEAVTLEEIARLYPQVYAECARAFPALVEARRTTPLKLRDRMQHHVSETARVEEAVNLLAEASATVDRKMRALGELIDQTHQSLRELYEVSTPEVEQLIAIVQQDPQVYGARLMGGGFGGNVLALTVAKNAASLIDRVQTEFYQPRNRDGLAEGSVMTSTPGEGLSEVQL